MLTNKSRLFFVGLLILLIMSACGGDSVGPTIIATSLAKATTSCSISVVFSGPMNRPTVESALSVAGSEIVAGNFMWPDDNTVIFIPDSRWKTHHEYTLTIDTSAKDSSGRRLQETFDETFRPDINLHDVNGDGVGDFMLGAPGHDSASKINAGQAYLFLGKSVWSDVDLSTQKADATYSVEDGIYLGYDAKIVGDLNGDRFADLVITAPFYYSSNPLEKEGAIIIVFGSESPSDVIFGPGNFGNGMLTGDTDSLLGITVRPVGDINGDGLADFVVASFNIAEDYQKLWLILGQTGDYPTLTSISDVAAAVYTTNLTIFGELAIAGCDVNGDELDDLLFGDPQAAGGGNKRGEVYVVAGSDSPASLDLRTESASEKISGVIDDGGFGLTLSCGDINGDIYGDFFSTAPYANSATGREYLITGTNVFTDETVDSATATYTGAASPDSFGLTGCSLGDVNNDGFGDMLVGSFLKNDSDGMAYLFLGASAPQSVDMSAGGAANAHFMGKTDSRFGFCQSIGDVNNDDFNDILVGAPFENAGGVKKGQAYIIFGKPIPEDVDLNSENANITITGAADEDYLSVAPISLL